MTTPDENTPLIAQQSESSQETMSSSTTSTYWRVGALYGAAGVCLGAFGAHGLKQRISDPAKIASWGTAAQYQILHSIALLVARDNPLAAGLFTAGMSMFSGSIYALVLDPARFKFLGPVTPLGGLCLIGGWLALAFGKAPSVAAGELRL
ncbi:putative membrane protein [Diaporthe ampelina]|uniref:Putative membrane protein n=1 Tax=Diaporthe ampelina TaxID=1214573 RepID=A0A0G2HPZ7_9PEZI|nr:putative membrane protein [Diaporthe ampelina]